jgi:O-antigen/teichoic acid export membrane protein
VLWLTAAKLYFMATGFLLLLMLPALFEKLSGDQGGELYGRYRLVIGLVNLLNMVLIGGTIQAVSKFIAEREDRARAVKWQTLKIQTVVGGGLSLLLFLGADLIATRFYGQPELASYLRLASPIVLLYAYYAVIIGCMNGLRRFSHQASMDILFATSKVGLTILFVAIGFAIAGAIGGFLATAVVLLLVSTLLLGRLPKGEPFPWQRIVSFEWKTLVFAFFLNGLLQVDLQLVGAMAPAHLGTPDSQAGVYGLALQLGQLPYIATISVAFVVFPLMSQATFSREAARARQYVATTNRYVFLALAGMVAAMATEAEGILSLRFFPAVYAQGAGILSVLSVGYLFFASVSVGASIITASGRPMLSALLLGGMLLLSALLNLVAVPRWGGMGAAAASATAMLAGFGACWAISQRLFKAFLPAASLLRAVAAAGVVVALALFVEPRGGGLVLLAIRMVFNCALYFGVLALLGELTRGDWEKVSSMRRR